MSCSPEYGLDQSIALSSDSELGRRSGYGNISTQRRGGHRGRREASRKTRKPQSQETTRSGRRLTSPSLCVWGSFLFGFSNVCRSLCDLRVLCASALRFLPSRPPEVALWLLSRPARPLRPPRSLRLCVAVPAEPTTRKKLRAQEVEIRPPAPPTIVTEVRRPPSSGRPVALRSTISSERSPGRSPRRRASAPWPGRGLPPRHRSAWSPAASAHHAAPARTASRHGTTRSLRLTRCRPPGPSTVPADRGRRAARRSSPATPAWAGPGRSNNRDAPA